MKLELKHAYMGGSRTDGLSGFMRVNGISAPDFFRLDEAVNLSLPIGHRSISITLIKTKAHFYHLSSQSTCTVIAVISCSLIAQPRIQSLEPLRIDARPINRYHWGVKHFPRQKVLRRTQSQTHRPRTSRPNSESVGLDVSILGQDVCTGLGSLVRYVTPHLISS